jgi:hypothetical protein
MTKRPLDKDAARRAALRQAKTSAALENRTIHAAYLRPTHHQRILAKGHGGR